jgi:hypothetical protein
MLAGIEISIVKKRVIKDLCRIDELSMDLKKSSISILLLLLRAVLLPSTVMAFGATHMIVSWAGSVASSIAHHRTAKLSTVEAVSFCFISFATSTRLLVKMKHLAFELYAYQI